MSKRLKIYLALFAAAIVLLMYLEYTKPKPIDWTKTYSAKDKIPFGAFVLAEELPKLFPDKNIEIIDKQSITTFMIDNDNVLSGDNSTLFILSGNNLYDGNFDYLLDFVKNGNDVFFVTNNFPKSLQDTLKLKKNTFIANIFKKNSYTIYSILCNNYLDTTKYYFKKQNSFSYFFDFDIKNTVVLGQYVCDSSIYTNFIKTSFGNGNFYINLLPEAFTNYYMLNDSTFEYAVNSLNYIKKSNIYFYEYKKSKKVNENESLLMYIFANPPLHWAWLIFIWGMVIYALFAGKRLQRVIPIIEPLKNSTVEFTQTLGDMYYNSRNFSDLIDKKIKYFLFFVKKNYYLDIKNINPNFSQLLSLKSGVSKEITDKIVELINKNNSTEKDLKAVNEAVEKFFEKN